MIPEVFASGIISKTGDHLHSCVSFSPDGREIYFTRRVFEPSVKNTIYVTRETDEGWSHPRPAFFSGEYDDDSAVFTPDGRRMYFTSNRPVASDDTTGDLNFWYIERIGTGWSDPVYAGDILNSDSCDFRLTFARNGTVYLSSDRAYTGRESFDIFVSNPGTGGYSEPEILGESITTPATEQVGVIAPDERYLLFYRYDPAHRDMTGLYISFRRKDGSWTVGKNMGPLFNDPPESCTQAASLSPDGKYLFFLRRAHETVYWVDAKILEGLKPDHLQ
ncbi:PD40 domain-containing protein [bacterium]|nr:PD40 domain-containing protein [bacterium]